jgi:hypothetical protein
VAPVGGPAAYDDYAAELREDLGDRPQLPVIVYTRDDTRVGARMPRYKNDPESVLTRRLLAVFRRLDSVRRPGAFTARGTLHEAKDKALNLSARDLAEQLTDVVEGRAMVMCAGLSNEQLQEKAVETLRHLRGRPLDADASRHLGLIAVELERRGQVDLYEQARKTVARELQSVA